jgi:uncharacterized OB-fold protein
MSTPTIPSAPSAAASPPSLPPFQAGAFDSADGEIWLLGSRCASCGRHFYPRTALCLNCLSSDLAEIRLSRDGVLECFTRVFMPALRIAPPYDVGYVTLPEGVRVFAPLLPGPQPFAVGMAMRLVPWQLGSGTDKAAAYAFAPVPR